MESYGDRVVEMILIDGTSHEICAAMHLCLFAPAPPKIIVESVLPLEKYSPSIIEGSAEEVNGEPDTKCVLCEYVISTLASKIKDNSTEEEIKSEVEQVCTYFPKTVRGNCRAFVEMYGDMIIQYLVEEMDPDAICTELKLCKPKLQDGYNLNLNRCELCNVISDYLSKKLEDPTFEKEAVATAALKFCPLLRNLRPQCTEMIEDYGPYMMALLAEKEDNEKVCNLIDIC
jgi:saposin